MEYPLLCNGAIDPVKTDRHCDVAMSEFIDSFGYSKGEMILVIV